MKGEIMKVLRAQSDDGDHLDHIDDDDHDDGDGDGDDDDDDDA